MHLDVSSMKKKRSKEEERLEIMDRKLKAMENLIVEDTAQYFSHHRGNVLTRILYFEKKKKIYFIFFQ